ncbi:MAG: hypothetical protein R3D58_14040 [Saprospiraceae bacterium]
MKNVLTCLAATAILFSTSCRKEACIKGILLDAKTNEPISNARITLSYQYTDYGSIIHTLPVVYSDKSGNFSFSTTGDNNSTIGVLYINATGYSEVFTLERTYGDCDEVVVRMAPLDGLLYLTIINATGTHDSIYAEVFNKCQYRQYLHGGVTRVTPYPLTLQPGESFNQAISTCVQDSSALRWKFSKNDPWFQIDSFWVDSNAPMSREISY